MRNRNSRRGGPIGIVAKGVAAISMSVFGLAVLAVDATPASAAVTPLTSPTTVSGTQTLSSTGLTASGAGVTATTDLVTTLQWTQTASLGTAFDPNLVRQGRNLNPSDSYAAPSAGTMTISWTLANTSVSWGAIGPLSLGSPSFSASGPCTLLAGGPDYTCHLTSSQTNLLDTYPLPGPYVKLALGADVTISPQGLATIRSTTFGGNAGPSAPLVLGASPITDTLAIPCTVGAGDNLNYSLGSLSNTDGISVNTNLIFDVGLESPLPVPPFTEVDVSFATPSILIDSTSSTIDMSGAGASFDMGNVLPNNVPPVANAGGAYGGDEGSAITFDGSASSSICGFPTLQWNFSDGGVAYGPSPQHTFEAPGIYSGLLTATDATGLTATTTFSVAVADLPPVTNAGSNIVTEWGVPVTLNGSATDPGTAQQPFLTYGWDFGDGTGSSIGTSVTHSYSTPGSYSPTFTACDPELMCGSSTTTVSVLQRATVLSYTGATSSDVTDPLTFKASLVDDRGAAVVGRVVNFYADGSAVPFASAPTNGLGIASATYAFPLGSVGTHSVVAAFSGDVLYTSNSFTSTFTVSKDATVLTYTGAVGAKPSHTAALSATLTDDAGRGLVGMTVNFTLGTQGCTAVSDSSGVAACTIAKLTQKTGDYVVTVSFANTSDYLGSNASSGFTMK